MPQPLVRGSELVDDFLSHPRWSLEEECSGQIAASLRHKVPTGSVAIPDHPQP